jgi:hypothetical protein
MPHRAGPSVDRHVDAERIRQRRLTHSLWSSDRRARALTGDAPFEFEWEPTHDVNAVNAREHASMSKDQAAEEVEAGWTRLRP